MVCNCFSRRGIYVCHGYVAITFLICCLLVYYLKIHGSSLCSTQSDCSKSLKPITEKLRRQSCNTACNTKECMDISNYMLGFMNQTADPCEDFYNFACGKLIDRYDVHENYSIFTRIAGDFYRTLKDVIESSNEPYGTAMHKLKVVYDSCMTTGSSELRSTQTLLSFLRHVGLRNWPYLNSNFTFQNPQLPELLGKFNSYNQDVFFSFASSPFNVSENPRTLRILQVGYSSDPYDRESKKFERIVTRILRKLGLDFKSIQKMWKGFITIQKQINKLKEGTYDYNYTSDTGFEIFKCLDEKDEKRILVCKILDSVVRNGKLSSRFHKNQVHMNDWELYYVEHVYGVIKKYSDSVIANYIALRVLLNNMEYMNFFNRISVKVKHEEPKQQGPTFSAFFEKWKYCVLWIAENMPYPLGAMYVEKVMPKEAAVEVDNMVQELFDTTANFILQQEWIGEIEKKAAVKEVTEQENVIHLVNEIMKNKTKINVMYKRFNPTRSSFMRNVFMYKKFLFTSILLNGEYLQNIKDINPFMVNAFGGGYIYLTYGILMPPYFKHGNPKLFNIAQIGYITGHEIGHTLFYFLEGSSHLDNKTQENFKEKLDCLIDQYFNFEQKRIKKYVKGNQTITENFPDNMSLKVVEKISEKYISEMTKSGFTLPGISYSPEELFYISYAQAWCETQSLELELLLHEKDVHCPSEFRILGALQNSAKFSRVFNCSKTSYMNLQKKCSVFD